MLRHMGILVPWPGIELKLPAFGVQSLSYWTTREVPPSPSLSACPPIVLVEPIPALDPQQERPCLPATLCTTILIQSNNSEEQTQPHQDEGFPAYCLVLSWQSTPCDRSREMQIHDPFLTAWPPSRLEFWETYVLLCNTGLLTWNRLPDISLGNRFIRDQLRIVIQGLQLTSFFFWWKSTVPAQCQLCSSGIMGGVRGQRAITS